MNWEAIERRQWTYFALFISILLVIVPSVCYLNAATSIDKTHALATGDLDPRDVPSSFNGVIIMGNVTSVNPSAYKFTVRYLFVPVGNYSADNSASFKFAENVYFQTSNSKILFTTFDPMPIAIVDYEFLDGSPIRYPFDKYLCDYTISMVQSLPNGSYGASIPIAVGLIPAKQSWSANADLAELEQNRNEMSVRVVFYRSWMTKMFAMFVSMVLWVLAITLAKLVYDLWNEGRCAESPTMRLTIRFLFAFPALRFIQPGLPVLGCTEDVAVFFWVMAIAAICVIIVTINYMTFSVFQDTAKSKPIGKWAPFIEFYDSDDEEPETPIKN